MRRPTIQLAQRPLEGSFYYQWNSARRRAQIAVALLATLLALAVFTAYPLRRLLAAPTEVKSLAVVSAASFSGAELTGESMATAYGTGLASTTQIASGLPLPTNLAGTTVSVRDIAGSTRAAMLYYVSSSQVNFLFPTATLPGLATVTITAADGSVSVGNVMASLVAPGLYTFNANGQGVVVAVALRVRGTEQSYESIARFDTTKNRWVATPIDLGPEGDRVFLVCFGTGFRYRSSLANVVATIGGTNVPVSYAWKQGNQIGLDQANLELVRSLSGRGEVDLTLRVDGKASNTVRVNIK